VLFLLCVVAAAAAQDSEPRRWTHLPVGTNIAGVSYIFTDGDIHVDPTLRIDNARLEMHTLAASYSRYFGLAEMTARVDVQLPVQSGRWHGLLNGVETSVTRSGLADPRVRLSLNFVGAPALEGEAFQAYLASHEERTTAGVAVALRAPLGEYREDKLINLGENRWSVEPQLGVVHSSGPWSGELTGSAFVYTPNNDFFNGLTLRQDPLYAIQGHVVRTFGGGFWVSADAAYGRGGETEISGVDKEDLRSNLLYGFTVGFSLESGQSFRLGYLRREALNNVGLDAHNVLLTWSIRF
jgi:hypothetical protein